MKNIISSAIDIIKAIFDPKPEPQTVDPYIQALEAKYKCDLTPEQIEMYRTCRWD